MNHATVIRDRAGQVVKAGLGLKPIVDYARAHGAERVDIHVISKDSPAAELGIKFSDGATCTTAHDDAELLRDLVSRAHWAGSARVVVHRKA